MTGASERSQEKPGFSPSKRNVPIEYRKRSKKGSHRKKERERKTKSSHRSVIKNLQERRNGVGERKEGRIGETSKKGIKRLGGGEDTGKLRKLGRG